MPTPSRGGRAGTSMDLANIELAGGQPSRQVTIYDSAGNAWMPAGQPAPVMVQGVEPRVLDFPIFWNRQTPRGAKARDSGGVTFAQLRALSRQTHVRVVLETVKDRQSKTEYSYTLKSARGEKPSETRKRAKDDPRIATCEEFWQQPDPDHEWIDWQRDMLEQVLVCDNLTLLRRGYAFPEARAILFGEEDVPVAVEIIDGDTIFPLIDNTGRRPVPPYPAYEQYIHGLKTEEFTSDEMLYCVRNVMSNRIYSGGSPVEQLLFYINMILRRDVTKLDFYTKGNVPAGFMPMPKEWSQKQVQDFTAWLHLLLSGDPEMRSKIIPIPGGTGSIDHPQKEILQDAFDDAWLRLVCFCFSIPVSSLVKEMTRATADTSKQQATEEGETVLNNWIGKLQTKIIRKWFGWSDIIAVTKQQLEFDAEKRAKIYDVQVKNGTLQIDEVREEEGRDPFNLPPGYMTATGFQSFEQAMAPTPDPLAADPQKGALDNNTEAPAKSAAVPFDLSKAVPTDAVLPIILRTIKSDDDDIQRLIKKLHEQGIELGAEQIAELIGESSVGIVALDNANVLKFLATRANLITSVNETTAGMILDAIRDAVTKGGTPEDMTRAIRNAFDLRKAQAANIARTENGSALNGGRFIQMDEEGVDSHEWLTSGDGKVRESHEAINREVVRIGELFSNGLLYPQDPAGPASETCNCRCISMPVGIAKLMKADARSAHWHEAMAAAGKIEKQMGTVLRGYFDKQQDQVLNICRSIGLAA